MTAPIADFVRNYNASGTVRFHMPGHKGKGLLGCEAYDITEISGADALYEANGIIAESERNAAGLFGTALTLYSTEGSSQCIRAMIYLAVTERKEGAEPLILAGRNAHKAFLYALALTGADVEWLWGEDPSLCSCTISPEKLEEALKSLSVRPAAVYLTSPDYLGKTADITSLAAVCRRYDVPLLVDNAHGAYQHFLTPPEDPVMLGAAMCCASAHKTLPVLTGGAYLHLSQDASSAWLSGAKRAMELFGSTSPSYLILQSLDLCNQVLANGYSTLLQETVQRVEACKKNLQANGWDIEKSDPLRIVLRGNASKIAGLLRRHGMEPEYSDSEYIVLMVSPENNAADLVKLQTGLGSNDDPYLPVNLHPREKPARILSVRQALFSPQEEIPVEDANGRICASPSVSCPPAIPIAIAGERIGLSEITLFRQYRLMSVCVVK